MKPGPVYVKCHVRNKNDLLVEEAELIEANPHYAHVKLNDGRETNVSLRDIARNPVTDAANNTNLSSHPDDTENTILPQSDNESNPFSLPDITSNGQILKVYHLMHLVKLLIYVVLHVFADLSTDMVITFILNGGDSGDFPSSRVTLFSCLFFISCSALVTPLVLPGMFLSRYFS